MTDVNGYVQALVLFSMCESRVVLPSSSKALLRHAVADVQALLVLSVDPEEAVATRATHVCEPGILKG